MCLVLPKDGLRRIVEILCQYLDGDAHDFTEHLVPLAIGDNRYICMIGLGQQVRLQAPDFIKMLFSSWWYCNSRSRT